MQTINITVPKGWHELSQKQLRYVFFLLSEEYTAPAIKTLCLFRWSSSIAYSDTSVTDTRTAVSATEQSSSTGVYEPPTQGTVLAIVIAGLVILSVFLYRYFSRPKPQ
jgi:hypothetical protein